MSFKKLYQYANDLGHRPIRVQADLCAKVLEITAQDAIEFVPVELDPGISLGHIKQWRQSKGLYDADPQWISSIRWHNGLNMCWRRYVCCKELMHVFDATEAQTDTSEKFQKLLDELEAPPLSEQASPMYRSEQQAHWKALLVLAPQNLRSWATEQKAAGKSPYDIALALRIPEILIRALLGDRYEPILRVLTE